MFLAFKSLISKNGDSLLFEQINRPIKLSDPHQGYGEHLLSVIIDKNDSELTGVDYQILFNTNLASGTFEEVIYFLPESITYLLAGRDDCIEMLNNWSEFISVNHDKFAKFGLSEPLSMLLQQLFDSLTNEFHIVHLNKAQCANKGWSTSYFDYVKHGFIVCGLVNSFCEYDVGKLIINRIISRLKDRNNKTSIAWLLEMYKECSEAITPWFSDNEIDALLAYVLENIIEETNEPTYWETIFEIVGRR